MKPTTRNKFINVFGLDKVCDLEDKANSKHKWITRHCNTLYIIVSDTEAVNYNYYIEKNSNRLHKFKDTSKLIDNK